MKTSRTNVGGGDRLPPHSEEAERGVLGCALQPGAAAWVLARLEERRFAAEEFYDVRHQAIYHALQKRYTARDGSLDVVAVVLTLREMGMLDEVGGVAYLNELQDVVPSAENLDFYADQVRVKHRLRRLVKFCAETAGRAMEFDGNNVGQLFDAVEQGILDLSAEQVQRTERHIKAVLVEEVLPMIEKHYNRGSTQLDGLPTGKDWYLDKKLLGIAPSDYFILAGRPGEGKTSLALNIVNYLAKDYEWWEEITRERHDELAAHGKRVRHQEATEATEDAPAQPEKWFQFHQGIPVGIFTLEMTEASLGFRLVFSRAQVSSGTFRSGFASNQDFVQTHKAVAELASANIYLDGEPDQTIDQIAAKARRWAKQYGIKLFVLDYLQLLDADDNDNDRVRALRKISKKIVALKKRLGIPWLVLAQMNRNIETAERARQPMMSDLKESGSLEQDADKIVILYHPLKSEKIEEDEEKIDLVMRAKYGDEVPWDVVPRRINALVVKNRNGPTGAAALLFQNNQCLFHDWRRWCLEHRVDSAAAGERKPKIDDEDVP